MEKTITITDPQGHIWKERLHGTPNRVAKDEAFWLNRTHYCARCYERIRLDKEIERIKADSARYLQLCRLHDIDKDELIDALEWMHTTPSHQTGKHDRVNVSPIVVVDGLTGDVLKAAAIHDPLTTTTYRTLVNPEDAQESEDWRYGKRIETSRSVETPNPDSPYGVDVHNRYAFIDTTNYFNTPAKL